MESVHSVHMYGHMHINYTKWVVSMYQNGEKIVKSRAK